VNFISKSCIFLVLIHLHQFLVYICLIYIFFLFYSFLNCICVINVHICSFFGGTGIWTYLDLLLKIHLSSLYLSVKKCIILHLILQMQLDLSINTLILLYIISSFFSVLLYFSLAEFTVPSTHCFFIYLLAWDYVLYFFFYCSS
jgi:hypothetical protein